jgi:hypothetical protein
MEGDADQRQGGRNRSEAEREKQIRDREGAAK